MRPNVAFTRSSKNKKTGPIPVSTTEAGTCPASCPLMRNGCYAEGMPLKGFWDKVTARKPGYGMPWDSFLAKVKSLPKGTLWRHNQAGDLPGISNLIDRNALRELTEANRGRNGFTYTHKPASPSNVESVREANEGGFVINWSANSLSECDTLAALGAGPVVTLLPADTLTNVKTPQGRTVVICPAITHEEVTCETCALCSRGNRPSIVGFPAHGTSFKKADRVAVGRATQSTP